MNCNDNCQTIADILNVIYILQENVCPNDSCLETCDRKVLGYNCGTLCNTRPVTLYNCGCCNTALSLPITKEVDGTTSSVFRVEKVDDCSVTLRVLEANSDEDATYPYLSTNSFCTVSISCICIIKCLDDTYVECL